MLLDWFTVAAQIVNFVVLVALLKHFLYGRIIRAIDAREDKIATRLAESAEKEKQSKANLDLYQAKLLDLEQERVAMLAQARADADRQHTELLEKARARVQSLETKWKEDLDRERDAVLSDLQRRAATEILAIVRRVVSDLACMDIQQCAVKVLLEKLRSLDAAAWIDLAQGEILVRSAFDLPDDSRTEIRKALEDLTAREVRVRFERTAAMAWGLELRANGHRIGWSSESYLELLEEDFREALEKQAESIQPAVTK